MTLPRSRAYRLTPFRLRGCLGIIALSKHLRTSLRVFTIGLTCCGTAGRQTYWPVRTGSRRSRSLLGHSHKATILRHYVHDAFSDEKLFGEVKGGDMAGRRKARSRARYERLGGTLLVLCSSQRTLECQRLSRCPARAQKLSIFPSAPAFRRATIIAGFGLL